MPIKIGEKRVDDVMLKNGKWYILGLVALLNPSWAIGYSLQDAIINAHENNQSIMAQLEKLRGARMGEKGQFMSEFLPDVSAGAQYNKVDKQRYPAAALNQQYPNNKYLSISQSLFNSGGSWARVKSASSSLDATEAGFIAASQQLSLDTVTAYESVITSRVVYDININNRDLAAKTLEYTQIKFKHGELTKTDVMQAEANFASAVAGVEDATAQLKSADGTFERLTGIKTPEKLEPVVIDHITLPPSLEELTKYALDNNPNYISAKYNMEKSEYDVLDQASRVLPSVAAQVQTSRTNTPKYSTSNPDGTTYTLNVKVPIIPNGGAGFTNIVQAKHTASQQKAATQETANNVKEAAIKYWSGYKSALAQVKARKENVKYSQGALDGITEEEKIGTRTILDVLKTQQDLFAAKNAYANAEQSLIVAVYSMLNLTGQIDTINIQEREQ